MFGSIVISLVVISLLLMFIIKQLKKAKDVVEPYIMFNQKDALTKVAPGFTMGIPYEEQYNLLEKQTLRDPHFSDYKPTFIDLYQRIFGINPPQYANGKAFHRRGLVLSQVPQALYGSLGEGDRQDEVILIE